MDRKYEERIHALVLNTIKLVLPTLAFLISALRKRAMYRLAQTGLLLILAIMMIGFNRHLTKIHHQQNEQIDQLQNELQQAKTIAQIDSARQLQMRRIVSIIDRFNPEMEAELKFNIADEIYTMSLKYRQLDVDLICATITHETARTWNPEAISFAGALGLMQILPSTGIDLAQQEGIRWTSAEEILFNPIYNVRLGCRYLEMLITDYGLEAGLAGYNGGGRQAKRWLRGGRADSLLHPETAYYVPAVLKIYREYRNTRL
jgi:soluble lytic murein transglycosylase